MDFPYPVRLSDDLKELLKPNAYLAGLGIEFSERITTVLEILKGSLIPQKAGKESMETIPEEGFTFSIPFIKGPYIREGTISIKAELTDDDGNTGILLTAIHKTE